MTPGNRLYQAVAVLLALSGALSAQDTETPTFDVASVKPHPSGDLSNRPQPGGFQPGGRFTSVNIPLRFVIASAYGVGDDRVVGGPGWLATDRFDISAKGDESAPRAQMTLMVRALLAQRFQLAVHTESRETPIYSLIVARRDGRLGSQLRPTSPECVETIAARRRAQTPQPQAPPPSGPPVPGEKAQCGRIRVALTFLTATGITLSDFASILPGLPRGVVSRIVDQTGLMGPIWITGPPIGSRPPAVSARRHSQMASRDLHLQERSD